MTVSVSNNNAGIADSVVSWESHDASDSQTTVSDRYKAACKIPIAATVFSFFGQQFLYAFV
jgi:hypothetical protein